MTSPFGGDQLVLNPATGQWQYASSGGGATDFNSFVQQWLAKQGQGEDATFPYRTWEGTQFFYDPEQGWIPVGASTTGGGGGSTWRPGEYGLEQEALELTRQHNANIDALDRLKEDRERLNDEHTRAYNQGNLALSRDIENRMAANEAQTLSLKSQQLALDAAIGQANVGANVYGTQTQGRSSQLSTLATLAQAAGEAQANPWNPMGYLDLINASGGATPYSNATAGQNTTYANQMAQNWQNTYGGVAGQLNQSIANTYETPDAITAAMQQMQPWYQSMPSYQGSSPSQQALFKSLQPAQQSFLASATPEQMRYIANPPQTQAQTPWQRALATYGHSTEGERAALARATPEQLRRLWEAGQVA